MNSRQAPLAIHLAALLFGLSGIFGGLIQAGGALIIGAIVRSGLRRSPSKPDMHAPAARKTPTAD